MAHDHHQDTHGSAHEQGHGHAHDHGDIDWAEMAPHLEAQAELYTPLYRQALAWLGREVTDPGLVVDVGSGPGVVSCLFADAFPGARVVAADGAAPLLERARARAERLGFGDRFGTLAGDLPGALADLDYPADLMWASQSLHHLPDQRAALADLGGHLAPGGTLAILEGGLPARFLPRDIGIGRPGLQARLRAVEEDAFAEMRADLPDSVAEAEDWPAMLTAAGLKHTGTRSFLLDLPAPVSDAARAYVTTSLSRLRERIGDRLDAGDLATLDRLLDPADEAGVHRRRDLFVLVAHTVYTAVRPV
ncbi:methyltransferase domain-containing protein [Streptomyces sp. R1]|uniref:class I SAM-dependent methyltransferase n=1 Tax=Streptomyces TaxID=1883 RepID=UPI00052AA776|nr:MULTISPECIES: class I SAM-dependent methyltransferase [unclassified Streptomyces]AIV33077.1 SAM-dependent methyltransferase [Streptomyces sp. CCM_MD2014]MCC8338686.1 methyltransferase domain-containing protein [Streptomyces sp. R1]MDA4886073.1 methyltransferase domain-containing protein [Streptomyces sp. MS2A]MYS56918.1 methyltransferase domain-containing protein [Streptomyces sp. SID6013]